MKAHLLAIASTVALLSACGNANDRAEDKMEAAAEASADAAGTAVAALGLTERQLLDADLIGANNVELGDVAQIVRGADGKVEKLLIEVEDSNPDRFVHVPIAGLTVVKQGMDTDLQSPMTPQQIAALPAVALPK